MVACKEDEQKVQQLSLDEIRLQIFNLRAAYNLRLITMNDVVRLIKNMYEVNDVPNHPHNVR